MAVCALVVFLLAVTELSFDVFLQLMLCSLQCPGPFLLQEALGILEGVPEEALVFCFCFLVSVFLDPFGLIPDSSSPPFLGLWLSSMILARSISPLPAG